MANAETIEVVAGTEEIAVAVVATGIAEEAAEADLRLLMGITAQPPKNNSQQLRMERRQARTDKVKCE